MNPRNTAHSVETGIKTQDTCNTVALHNGYVEGVAGRKSSLLQHDFPSTLDIFEIDRKNLAGNCEKPIKGGAQLHPGDRSQCSGGGSPVALQHR